MATRCRVHSGFSRSRASPVTDPERPQLTFFFPAYNEEENVAETVRRALAEVGPLVDGSIEVLIVDDGSTDRTPELADALAACRSARPRPPPGQSWLRRRAAGRLRQRVGGADLLQRRRPSVRPARDVAPPRPGSTMPGKPVDAVIGYRIKRRDPPHRIFIAKTYNAIVSILFGLRVRDIDCAMKVFRREVFDGLPLTTDSPFLSAELLDQAQGARRADRPGRRERTTRGPPARTPAPRSARSCARSATSGSCAGRCGRVDARCSGRRGRGTSLLRPMDRPIFTRELPRAHIGRWIDHRHAQCTRPRALHALQRPMVRTNAARMATPVRICRNVGSPRTPRGRSCRPRRLPRSTSSELTNSRKTARRSSSSARPPRWRPARRRPRRGRARRRRSASRCGRPPRSRPTCASRLRLVAARVLEVEASVEGALDDVGDDDAADRRAQSRRRR